ncbi:MAG: hypothetical protein ACOH12_10520 [Parvibaculaceae bacterium]
MKEQGLRKTQIQVKGINYNAVALTVFIAFGHMASAANGLFAPLATFCASLMRLAFPLFNSGGG